MGTQLTKFGGADVAREEFGATQIEVVRETAAAAVAAREKAAVEARYIVAMRKPRNIEYARQQLLKACDNKYFAASAWFDLTRHNRGEGFTIRFAEEALRCFGNVYPETSTVYENAEIRMIRVTVTDLESNLSYSSEIIVQKTVERKQLRKGQKALSERVNSYGDTVYIVEATDDEITVKQNAALSKAIRTNGLRLIPSWLKEEAKRRIVETMHAEVKQDIDAAKRRVIDSFVELGVKVPDLEAYLGHGMEHITPKGVTDLRQIYTAIKDGDLSWAEVMDSRQPAEEEKHGSKEAAQKVAEEKLRKAKEAQQPKEGQPGPEDEPEPDAKAEHTQRGQNRGFSFGGGRK